MSEDENAQEFQVGNTEQPNALKITLTNKFLNSNQLSIGKNTIIFVFSKNYAEVTVNVKNPPVYVCSHTSTEIRNAKEATCKEPGYTGDTYCKYCGRKLSSGEEIAIKEHSWDEGVVTKESTTTEKGEKTFTCTVCGDTKTEEIPVLKPEEPVIPATESGFLKIRSVKQTNTSITLIWAKVEAADGYIIYGNQCNNNGKKYSYKKLKTITNNNTLTWTQKNLKKAKHYKYKVKAYQVVNGKTVVINTSMDIHVVTKGGKYGVAKAVSITKISGTKSTTKVTLAKGKTATIKAKEIPADKPISQHRAICYESSDKNVATVTKIGVIQAKGKGSCKIYVYAQNGVYKTVTVTVK